MHDQPVHQLCAVEWHERIAILRMVSDDGTNRLSIARVRALTDAIALLANEQPARLIITGNTRFFSAGADLHEIAALTGPEALRFAHMGQATDECRRKFSGAHGRSDSWLLHGRRP